MLARRPGPRWPSRCAARRCAQEGDTLVLEVPPDFSAFADMHADEYRELARRAAGRPLKVRIGAGAAAAPTPTPRPRSSERRTLATKR